MSYPSDDLRKWFDGLELLNKHTKILPQICQCGVFPLIKKYLKNDEHKKNLLNGLFWSIWIDQVIYSVLVDTRCLESVNIRRKFNIKKDEELYNKFRKFYPFIKINSHCGMGQANPAWLITKNFHNEDCPLPENKLLLEGKKDFWDNVSDWFDCIKKSDIKESIIAAFKEDLKLRFPKEAQNLF